MASVTAICLLGTAHVFGDGINLMHEKRLYENSVPTIAIMTPPQKNRDGRILGIWRAPIHYMDDLMLLAAYYALEDEAVIKACRALGCPEDTAETPWDLFDLHDKLPGLHELAKAAFEKFDTKLAVMSLKWSSLEHQMHKARDYKAELEFCPSVYQRFTTFSSGGRLTQEENGACPGENKHENGQ